MIGLVPFSGISAMLASCCMPKITAAVKNKDVIGSYELPDEEQTT